MVYSIPFNWTNYYAISGSYLFFSIVASIIYIIGMFWVTTNTKQIDINPYYVAPVVTPVVVPAPQVIYTQQHTIPAQPISETIEHTKPVATNYCSNCGDKIKEVDKFCRNCGNKII